MALFLKNAFPRQALKCQFEQTILPSHTELKLGDKIMTFEVRSFPFPFFRVQKMKFHGEDQSFLGDILLRVSAAGIFAYSVFNVVAGGLGVHSDLRNLLVMAVGGITIIQVQPWPLFHLLLSFQTHIRNFTTNRYVKNDHPVYGTGIRTQDLWNMSCLP